MGLPAVISRTCCTRCLRARRWKCRSTWATLRRRVKTVQVVLDNGISWDDARICNFAVLPNTPLQTFTVRGETTTAWSDIRLEINPGPPDGIPDLMLDNVHAYYRPGSSYPVTECASPPAPEAPADTNLVRNGTSTAARTVGRTGVTSMCGHPTQPCTSKCVLAGRRAVSFQDFSYSLPTGAPVELTLQLGNTGWATKTVGVTLHNPDWSDAISCEFSLPPYTDFATYTVQGITETDWSDIRLEFVPGPADGIPDVHMDDVNVQYKPGLSVSATNCSPSGTIWRTCWRPKNPQRSRRSAATLEPTV